MKKFELDGAALDWAVAKCEGVNAETFRLYYEPTEPSDYDSHLYPEFHYSSIWAQGGPIIERESIFLVREKAGQGGRRLWAATLGTNIYSGFGGESIKLYRDAFVYGPTPLIAAMRCYVASKMGDDIDIPEELK